MTNPRKAETPTDFSLRYRIGDEWFDATGLDNILTILLPNQEPTGAVPTPEWRSKCHGSVAEQHPGNVHFYCVTCGKNCDIFDLHSPEAKCWDCNGSGHYLSLVGNKGRLVCRTCHGSGRIMASDTAQEPTTAAANTPACNCGTEPDLLCHVHDTQPFLPSSDITIVGWEANPTGARKIVMELVAYLDPTLMASPSIEKTIDAIQSLITRAQVEELQQIANLTPCNAHDKPSHGCADWIHYNVMQRISELNQENK